MSLPIIISARARVASARALAGAFFSVSAVVRGMTRRTSSKGAGQYGQRVDSAPARVDSAPAPSPGAEEKEKDPKVKRV